MRLARPAALVTLICLFALLAGCKSAPTSSRASSPINEEATNEKATNDSAIVQPAPAPTPPLQGSIIGESGRRHERRVPGDRSPASVEEPAPPSDDEILASALSKLKQGNLAYSTPEKMKAGQTAHVVARIGGDSISITTLKEGLPADSGQKIELAATPVATRMKMTLKSADFDITPLSSEEQSVAGDTPTQWEWDIVPKHSGNLRLHLDAAVVLHDLARDFTTIDRTVAVQVDPVDQVTGFISKNWQWLIATATALIGAAWKYFSSRKDKAPVAP